MRVSPDHLPPDARELEDEIVELFQHLFARRDKASLDVVCTLACHMSSYIAELTATEQDTALRLRALDRLIACHEETARLIRQVDDVLVEKGLAPSPLTH